MKEIFSGEKQEKLLQILSARCDLFNAQWSAAYYCVYRGRLQRQSGLI